jgi:hypothetical protein
MHYTHRWLAENAIQEAGNFNSTFCLGHLTKQCELPMGKETALKSDGVTDTATEISAEQPLTSRDLGNRDQT